MDIDHKVGFIQGRLSPLVNGKIEAFPWDSWENEFRFAEDNGFRLMEWTLDQDRLYENPLLTTDGQTKIRELCKQHNLTIPSLTGDCFMQAPFWKTDGAEKENLKADFINIVDACSKVGISMVVVPLVDNGRLDKIQQEDDLISFLNDKVEYFLERGVKIIFESDFDPSELSRFISRLDSVSFGINYDIGNSAALGYSPEDEIRSYGHRIINVHIKDRVLGGTTVPLGTGNADFEQVFSLLAEQEYSGNLILQTARATDADHVTPLCLYRDMVNQWSEQSSINSVS